MRRDDCIVVIISPGAFVHFLSRLLVGPQSRCTGAFGFFIFLPLCFPIFSLGFRRFYRVHVRKRRSNASCFQLPFPKKTRPGSADGVADPVCGSAGASWRRPRTFRFPVLHCRITVLPYGTGISKKQATDKEKGDRKMNYIGIGRSRQSILEGISGGVNVRHGWRYPLSKSGKYGIGKGSCGATVTCLTVSCRNLYGL